jgi:thioredoxin-dependent peroxiredoxin
MREGDLVSDFELPDQNGELRSLTGMLAAGPLVLFFYPAAMTPGCTREACRFRDMAAAYRAAGVQRVGISRDAVAKQKRFADKHAFDYPLLSDGDGRVAKQFGVTRGPLTGRLLPAKRSTFAIAADGRVVKVIHSELHMDIHADRALAALTQHQ